MPTLGLPAVAFLQEQPRHSVRPCIWLGALAGRCQHQQPHSTVGQFCAFHYTPVSQGKPGPKTEGSYGASPCWHSSQLILLLSFQRAFMQTPRESPTTPQSRCTGQRRPYRRRVPSLQSESWSPEKASLNCSLLSFPREGERQTGPRIQKQKHKHL